MDYLDVFKRYEIKYLLTEDQKKHVYDALAKHARPDKYCRSQICNIYYDTPDFRLIRRSIEKPVYKEKLRVRSYGVPQKDGRVFVELKKKYNSVTYKRRVDQTLCGAQEWLSGGTRPDSQIAKEIDYAINFYKTLAPAVFISYEREAFTGNEEKDFRITFDNNILYRRDNLSLLGGIYGKSILPQGLTLMEVKTATAMPMWFTDVLTECKIFNTHFSKYGAAYEDICSQKVLHGSIVPAEKKIYLTTGDVVYA
ncbi:MAG: polyphosphate polymerase domain-containing protein [Clostridia bacterium]|nr:polyphosphate polymerase domain-containing protein [Clostridia bacterium]